MGLPVRRYDNFLFSQIKSPFVDFDTDNIKVLLVNSSYEPNQVNHVFYSDVITYEVAGTNYNAGGVTLTGATVSLTGKTVKFDADDCVWALSATGFDNARFAIIYKWTGVTTTSRLIAYVDLLLNNSNTITNFKLVWGPEGIMSWFPLAVPSTPVVVNTRARPVIAGGTIKTDTGKILRGCTMDLRTSTNPVSSNSTVWKNFRNSGLNVVRYDVKTVVNGRPVAQQLPYIDAAVNNAENNRMYIMLMQSVTPGSYNKAELLNFWGVVAPRYKDRPCVLYEMTNEPTSWGQPGSFTDTILQDIHDVYVVMRNAAPVTPIMLFSAASLYNAVSNYLTMITNFEAKGSIDWTKTCFSYHHYPPTYDLTGTGTGIYGFSGLNQLKTRTPIIMTESNDFMGDDPSNDPRNKTALWLEYERNGVSWINLDGKAGTINTQITNEILPFLATNGYPVPVE